MLSRGKSSRMDAHFHEVRCSYHVRIRARLPSRQFLRGSTVYGRAVYNCTGHRGVRPEHQVHRNRTMSVTFTSEIVYQS